MTDEAAAVMLREFLSVAVLGQVAEQIPTPHAPMRLAVAASLLVGLGVARYVVRLEPLASASLDDVAPLIASELQHILTGHLHAAG